jgi:hypothetical protein
MAKATASSSGAGKKKSTGKFYGKMVPVSSVGGGKVKAPTRASAARARTMVGAVVPGGAAVKGAMAAGKSAAALARLAKSNGTLVGSMQSTRAMRLVAKQEKATGATYRKLNNKVDKLLTKAEKNAYKDSAMKRRVKNSAKVRAKETAASNKATIQKLKNSGAIKRMK